MAEYGVPVKRVINGGGIPQHNAMLNQVYADVLGKPVLVPDGIPTSLGSGIFALVAAGVFPSVAEAQAKLCLPFKIYQPNPVAGERYERLFRLYSDVYFSFGKRGSLGRELGDVLPELRKIAAEALRGA
jgi:L-ribulokinase